MFFNNFAFISICKNAKLFPIMQQKYCHFLKKHYFCMKYSSCTADETLSHSFDIVFSTYSL